MQMNMENARDLSVCDGQNHGAVILYRNAATYYTRARGCLMIEGEYHDHWTSVKLSKRGKPKKSTSNYTHIQMVSINDNTIYYIQDGRGQPYFVQCYMPSNSVIRDACIHTLLPNTCTYAATTHTFLPFCLQV